MAEGSLTSNLLGRFLFSLLPTVDCKVALCAELAVPGTRFVAAAGVGVESGATPALGGDCRQSLVLAPAVAAGVAPD